MVKTRSIIDEYKTYSIDEIVNAIPKIISGIVNALIGNIDKIIMAGVELFIALIKNLPTIIVEIVKAVPKIVSGLFSHSTSKVALVTFLHLPIIAFVTISLKLVKQTSPS